MPFSPARDSRGRYPLQTLGFHRSSGGNTARVDDMASTLAIAGWYRFGSSHLLRSLCLVACCQKFLVYDLCMLFDLVARLRLYNVMYAVYE